MLGFERDLSGWVHGEAPKERAVLESHTQDIKVPLFFVKCPALSKSVIHLAALPPEVHEPEIPAQVLRRIPLLLQRAVLSCYSALESGKGYHFYRRVCKLDGIKEGT